MCSRAAGTTGCMGPRACCGGPAGGAARCGARRKRARARAKRGRPARPAPGGARDSRGTGERAACYRSRRPTATSPPRSPTRLARSSALSVLWLAPCSGSWPSIRVEPPHTSQACAAPRQLDRRKQGSKDVRDDDQGSLHQGADHRGAEDPDQVSRPPAGPRPAPRARRPASLGRRGARRSGRMAAAAARGGLERAGRRAAGRREGWAQAADTPAHAARAAPSAGRFGAAVMSWGSRGGPALSVANCRFRIRVSRT